MRRTPLILFIFLFISSCISTEPKPRSPATAGVKKADQCPVKIGTAPPCPKTSNLLDPTYPMLATVISDEIPPGATADYVSDYAVAVLEASGDQPPLIVLPVKPKTFASVQAAVKKAAKSAAQAQVWAAALRRVESDSYGFAQDFFVAIAGKNGQPAIRELDFYNPQNFAKPQVDGMFDAVAEGVSSCGIATGEVLHNPETNSLSSHVNGAEGGNIQALPGGICVIGDSIREDRWADFTKQFCPNPAADAIMAPTSWLGVGHTDEVMTTIGNAAPGSCGFTIVIASPEKAFEILSAAPKEPAMSKSKIAFGEAEQSLDDACKKAHLSGRDKECKALTNQELLDLIKNTPELKSVNDAIVAKLNKLKKDVTDKLKTRFPKCTIDILDAPQLYTAIWEKDANGAQIMSRGAALLPNLTNSVTVGTTVLSPEPYNDAVKAYMESEYKKRKLTTVYIDTLPQHVYGSGNLHCMSNQIRVCR